MRATSIADVIVSDFNTRKMFGEEQIQNVRMKYIQNNIIISHEVFIIHICVLHHYKGRY